MAHRTCAGCRNNQKGCCHSLAMFGPAGWDLIPDMDKGVRYCYEARYPEGFEAFLDDIFDARKSKRKRELEAKYESGK